MNAIIIGVTVLGLALLAAIIYLSLKNDRLRVEDMPCEFLIRESMNSIVVGQVDNEYSRELTRRAALAK